MKTIKYELYTESRLNLDALANKYFEGFTILHGLGYWKGEQEQTSCIVVTRWKNCSKVMADISIKRLVADIKRENNQEVVLVVRSNVNVEVL